MFRRKEMAYFFVVILLLSPLLFPSIYASVQIPVKVPKFPSLIHTLYEIRGNNISAGPAFDGRNILIVQEIGGNWYLRAINATTREVILNELVKPGVKRIIPFYWEGPYGGPKLVGIILEYEKEIEVFPDVYSSQGYWNVYSLNFTRIRAISVYGPYGYVLDERDPGTFILYKIYLPNGKICWETPSLELQSEVYYRIYAAVENYSKSVKGPITFLQNFEVIYEPLYYELLNCTFKIFASKEAVVLSLPMGPLIIINSSDGSQIASLFSDVLPQNYTENLSGPILAPYVTSYSFNGYQYVVAYSPGTEYIKAIETWSQSLGVPGMGRLDQDPGVLILNLSALISEGKLEYSFLSIFSQLKEQGVYVKEMDYNNTSVFLPEAYGSYVSTYGPFVVYAGNSYGYTTPSVTLESAPYSVFPTSSLFSVPSYSEIFSITVGSSGPYLSSRYTEEAPVSPGEIPSFQVLSDPAYIPVRTSIVLGILTSFGELQMMLAKYYGTGYELVHIWTYSGERIQKISPLSGVVWAIKAGKEIRIVSPAYIFPGYPRTIYFGGNVSFSDKYGPKYFDYSMGVWRRLVELKVYKNLTYEIKADYFTYNGSSGSVLSPKSWVSLRSPGENGIKIVLTTGKGENVISSLLYGHAFSDSGTFDVMVIQNNTWHTGGHDSANTYFSTYYVPQEKLEKVGEIPGRVLSVQIWKDRVYSLIETGGQYYAIISDQLGNVLYKVEVPRSTSSSVYNGLMYLSSTNGILYEVEGGKLKQISSVIPLNYTLRTFPGGVLMINESMGAIYLISFDGAIKWAKFLGERIYDFCIGHWSLYISLGEKILSFDLSTGYLNWEKEIGSKYLVFTILPYYSEFVTAISSSGTIYLLDPRNGEIRGEVTIPGNVSCHPAYDPFSGILYVAEYPYVYAISLRDLSYSNYLISEVPEELSPSPYGLVILAKKELITIPTSSGQERGYYVYDIGENATSFAATHDLLYLATSNGLEVVGINPMKVTPTYKILKAGEVLEVSVYLKNFEGVPLKDHKVYANSSSLKVITPEVMTGPNGTCEILAYSNETGNFTLKIWTEISGKIFVRYVRVEYLPSSPSRMIVTGPKEEIAGVPVQFEVKILDKYGNPVPGVKVEASAVVGNITPEGTTNSFGEVTFTYYNLKECYDQISFYVPGTSLREVTVIKVLPSKPYKLRIIGEVQNTTYQEAPYQVSLQLLDRYGNPEGPGYLIVAEINGKKVEEMKTNEEGIAYFSYVFKTPGNYFISFYLQSNKNVSLQLAVKVVPPPPEKISLIKYSSQVVAGEPFKVEVKVTNIFGFPAKGITVEFYVDKVLKGTYLTNSEGIVYAQAVLTKAGVHEATLKVKGMPYLSVNVSFEVLPSPILSPQISTSTSKISAGQSFVISMLLKDKYGNLVTRTVTITIGNVFKASYLVNGEKEVRIFLYKAGEFPITITSEGKVLWKGSIKVIPSTPEKILVESLIQGVAGEPIKVDVKVLDEYGNPVPGAKVCMKIKQFPSITFNTSTGLQGEAEFLINITLAGEYDATIYSSPASAQTKIIVEPNVPEKILTLTSNVLTAGEKGRVEFQILDEYNNTLPGISYSVKAPSEVQVENVTGETDSQGKITIFLYSTKEGEYTLSFYFPEYNKSLEAKVKVVPNPQISLVAELPKTSYSVGQEIVIKYEVKDKYGNPIPGALALPVIQGVSVKITSLIKTNSEGTGYVTIVPTSKGYGTVYLEYHGVKSNVLKFTVGNILMLKMERWLVSYWWTLVIMGFALFFAILFVKYMRTVGRWRSKLRRPLIQAFRPPGRSPDKPSSPFCKCTLQRP